MAQNFVVPPPQRIAEMIGQVRAIAPDLDPSTVLFSLSLLQSASGILGAMEQHFGRYGLSQGRYVVLMALLTQPERDWTPATLADYVGVTRATMTGLLDGLETGGYVARSPHPNDRRSAIISLTDWGRMRLKEMLPGHFRRVEEALRPISQSDRDTTARLMRATAQAFSTLEEDTPP